MNNIKPSVGRIIYVYLSEYHKEAEFKNKLNGAEFLPAIITQVFYHEGEYQDMCNVSVFTPFHGNVGLGSIRIEGKAMEGMSYYVWPQLNK